MAPQTHTRSPSVPHTAPPGRHSLPRPHEGPHRPCRHPLRQPQTQLLGALQPAHYDLLREGRLWHSAAPTRPTSGAATPTGCSGLEVHPKTADSSARERRELQLPECSGCSPRMGRGKDCTTANQLSLLVTDPPPRHGNEVNKRRKEILP